MAAASAGWAGLSAANKALWEDYAAGTNWTDVLGQSVTVTGFSAYCRWATLRHRVGESLIGAPPAGVTGFGSPPVGIAVEVSTPEATISIAPAAPDDGAVLLQFSAALSAGKASTRQPLFLDSFGAVAITSDSATTTPAASLVANERRVARAVVCYDDGRVSAAFEEVITIAAS
jgi:hypothetical protein